MINKKTQNQFVPPLPTTSFNGMFWRQNNDGSICLRPQKLLSPEELKIAHAQEKDRLELMKKQFDKLILQNKAEETKDLKEEITEATKPFVGLIDEKKKIEEVIRKLPIEDQDVVRESLKNLIYVSALEGEKKMKVQFMKKMGQENKSNEEIMEFMGISQQEYEKLRQII